jgi:hypothetical protein
VIAFDIKYIKNTCHKRHTKMVNQETRKLLSDAITVLPPANVYLLVQKPPVLSMHMEI